MSFECDQSYFCEGVTKYETAVPNPDVVAVCTHATVRPDWARLNRMKTIDAINTKTEKRIKTIHLDRDDVGFMKCSESIKQYTTEVSKLFVRLRETYPSAKMIASASSFGAAAFMDSARQAREQLTMVEPLFDLLVDDSAIFNVRSSLNRFLNENSVDSSNLREAGSIEENIVRDLAAFREIHCLIELGLNPEDPQLAELNLSPVDPYNQLAIIKQLQRKGGNIGVDDSGAKLLKDHGLFKKAVREKTIAKIMDCITD